MLYSEITSVYEKMEKTTKRLELTALLAELFSKTPKHLIDKTVYLTQGKLYPDYVGVELGVADKMVIKAIALSAGFPPEKVEEAYKRLGDLGLAAEEALKGRRQVTLFSEPLTVERVYGELERIARASGEGSVDVKLRHLTSLLNDASPEEAKYLIRTVTGKLRLGIADYTVLDALAVAFTGSKDNRPMFEWAYNISSDLGAVAKASAFEGIEGLRKFRVTVGRPVRPMLAERLTTAEEVVEKLGGRCAAEYKLDGERMQIHKKADEVVIFSRRLERITEQYPDAVDYCRNYVRAEEAILEVEAVAVNPDTGEYLPFQELMHRRRKYGVEEAMKRYPIALNFFDILYLDGEELLLKPYLERRRVLERVVVETEWTKLVPMLLASRAEEVEAFMEQAVTEGCEGLVVKDLNSVYRAGAREFAWVKLKREYRSELTDTLDLVIVGAFHGRGRRAGRYGAYLLAAYDKADDMFRSVCKVGTGFTDEDLESFHKLLEPLKIPSRHPRVDSRMEADVWFTPQVVIEVIASEITLSPIHTCCLDAVRSGSGLALRFPKYTGRLRSDKAPEDATTTDEILSMYRRQLKGVHEEVYAAQEP